MTLRQCVKKCIPRAKISEKVNLKSHYNKVFDVNYGHRHLFADFEETLSNCNLIQLVNFVTWSRMVGSMLRSSFLDLVYVKDVFNLLF